MLTHSQLICNRALKSLGVVAQGDVATAEDMLDAHNTLNEMVDSWANDNLTMAVTERDVFPIIPGVKTYTIGEGGDFDRQRPMQLTQASILLENSGSAGELELPMRPLTIQQWQNTPFKFLESTLPRWFYYNRTFPLAEIILYPVPQITILQIALYCPVQLTEFTTLVKQYDMPPGYFSALWRNLAIELAPDYDQEPSSVMVEKAWEKLGNIRRSNIVPVIVPVERALLYVGRRRRGQYNIFTGTGNGT